MTYNVSHKTSSRSWSDVRVSSNSIDRKQGAAPDAAPSPVTTGDYFKVSVGPRRS